jgi:outer membrane protein assembly factor BamB
MPPPVVPPITHEGVVYQATGDGETAFIMAKDVKTGKELWKAKVYHVQIDPLKEGDVQTIFFKGMLLSREKLLIQDEAGRYYRLDLKTQKVQGTGCGEYRALKSAK